MIIDRDLRVIVFFAFAMAAGCGSAPNAPDETGGFSATFSVTSPAAGSVLVRGGIISASMEVRNPDGRPPRYVYTVALVRDDGAYLPWACGTGGNATSSNSGWSIQLSDGGGLNVYQWAKGRTVDLRFLAATATAATPTNPGDPSPCLPLVDGTTVIPQVADLANIHADVNFRVE